MLNYEVFNNENQLTETIYPQQGYFLVLVPGKSFEVRNEDTVSKVKLAIEIRKDEISAKKRV